MTDRTRARTSTRFRIAGAAIALLYLGAAAVTLHAGRLRLRPLYDGVLPPSPYGWVSPPPAFAAGNVAPKRGQAHVNMVAAGSEFATVETADSTPQALMNLNDGAVPATPGVRSMLVTITPHAPSEYAPLPDGAVADGNAYDIKVVLEPGNKPLGAFAEEATVSLRRPGTSTSMYYTVDGHSWQILESSPTSSFVSALLRSPGIVVAGGVPPVSTSPTSAAKSSGGGSALPLILLGLAAVVLVAGVVLGVRRSRASQATHGAASRGSKR